MSSAVIDQYLATFVTRGVSVATQRAVRSDLAIFRIWWEARHQRSFDLRQVVDRDLRAWKVARQKGDGAAPATINQPSSARVSKSQDVRAYRAASRGRRS